MSSAPSGTRSARRGAARSPGRRPRAPRAGRDGGRGARARTLDVDLLGAVGRSSRTGATLAPLGPFPRVSRRRSTCPARLPSFRPSSPSAAGTALFVCGWCFRPRSAIEALEFVRRRRRAAVRRPRDAAAGPVRARCIRGSTRTRAQRSARPGLRRGSAPAQLRAAASGGSCDRSAPSRRRSSSSSCAPRCAAARQVDGRAGAGSTSWPRPRRRPDRRVAGVERAARGDRMATYNPPARSARAPARVDPRPDARQLDLRDQRRLLEPRALRDDRARRSATTRASSSHAVAAAPGLLPQLRAGAARWSRPRPTFVALADQDDVWHPDKLDGAAGAIGDAPAGLQRRPRGARATGELISETWWSTRAQQPHRPALAAGRQRGHRRRLAVPARPARRRAALPAAQFAHFHDHWIGACARCHGRDRLRRPAALRLRPARRRLARPRRRQPDALAARSAGAASGAPARARAPVAAALLRRRLPAAAVRDRARAALRFPDVRAASARALRPLPRADRSWPALLPPARAGRCASSSRRRPETLGAEWMLFHALLVAAAARRQRADRGRARRLRLDALAAARRSTSSRVARRRDAGVRRRWPRRSPRCAWRSPTTRPRAVNLLIPTIDLAHFFGGYIAQAQPRRAARRARAAVRIVTVDPVGPLPAGWRRALEGYSGLAGLFDSVEVVFGREAALDRDQPRDDSFVATTWWTAHIAADASPPVDGRALPLPDPGVRAVHLPDGHLRGAGGAVLRARLTSRCSRSELLRELLPRPPDRRLRRRRPGRDALGRRSRTRSPPCRRRPRPALAGRAPAPAAVLRAARGARRAQHVRARRAGARARAPATARFADRLGAARDRHRERRPQRSRAGRRGEPRAAAARGPGRLRRRCCASTTSGWRSCTRRTPASSRSRWPRRGCSRSPTASRTRRRRRWPAISPNLIAARRRRWTGVAGGAAPRRSPAPTTIERRAARQRGAPGAATGPRRSTTRRWRGWKGCSGCRRSVPGSGRLGASMLAGLSP